MHTVPPGVQAAPQRRAAVRVRACKGVLVWNCKQNVRSHNRLSTVPPGVHAASQSRALVRVRACKGMLAWHVAAFQEQQRRQEQARIKRVEALKSSDMEVGDLLLVCGSVSDLLLLQVERHGGGWFAAGGCCSVCDSVSALLLLEVERYGREWFAAGVCCSVWLCKQFAAAVWNRATWRYVVCCWCLLLCLWSAA